MARLSRNAPPALPIAPPEYTAGYMGQLLNVLRLFFNTLFNFQQQLGGDIGGSYIRTPYGQFSNTGTLTFSAADTPQTYSFTQEDYANGMHYEVADGIHVDNSGLYNYQYSVQLENSAAQEQEVTIWLQVNDVDLPNTASKFGVPLKHGAINGYTIAVCNFYVELTGGDHVSLRASTSSTSVVMDAYAASTVPYTRPAVPSVVATLTFVSALET